MPDVRVETYATLGRAFERGDANTIVVPHHDGRRGNPVIFAHRYRDELLVPALRGIELAWLEHRQDPAFQAELAQLLADYAGRPTPLYDDAGRPLAAVEVLSLEERDRCRSHCTPAFGASP